MKKKKISRAIRKRFDNIRESCFVMSDGFSMHSIHAFRVQVKKLQSYLELVSKGKKHRAGFRISGDLKKVYDSAGQIRNLQLQKQRLAAAFPTGQDVRPKTYLDVLRVEISLLKKGLRNETRRKKVFRRDSKKLLKRIPCKVGEKKISAFVFSETAKINEIIARKRFTDDELHHTRRILKYFMYDSRLLRKAGGKGGPGAVLNLKEFEAASGLIGRFHDLATAIEMIDQHLDAHVFWENEKELLIELRTKWVLENEALRLRIEGEMEKLRTILNRPSPEGKIQIAVR